MSWLRNVAIAIDQLGNALAGGNPDLTISARVGYHLANGGGVFWRVVAAVIDYTFKPLDGVGHCLQAYNADSEDYNNENGSDLARGVLSLIVVVACLVLLLPIRIFAALNRA